MRRSANFLLSVLLLAQAPVVACMESDFGGHASALHAHAHEVHWGSGWISTCPCAHHDADDKAHDLTAEAAIGASRDGIPRACAPEHEHERFAAFRSLHAVADSISLPAAASAFGTDASECVHAPAMTVVCVIDIGPPPRQDPATDTRRLI